MDKIKILVIPSNPSYEGVKRRMVDAHINLQKQYPDMVSIDIDENPNTDDVDYFASYDIVVFDKSIGQSYSKCQTLLNAIRLKNPSTKIVMDMDTYWMVDRDHPLFKVFKRNKTQEKILTSLTNVDGIISSNTYLTSILSKVFDGYGVNHNNNSSRPEIFTAPEIFKKIGIVVGDLGERNERVGLGFVVDDFNMHNLKILRDVTGKLPKDTLSKVQFVLTNFSIDGVYNEYNPITGEVVERIIKPEQSLSVECEKIITSNYKICSKEYTEFLKKYLPNEAYEGDLSKEPYVREWGKNSWSFEVLVYPLQKNTFNECLWYDSTMTTANNKGVGVMCNLTTPEFSGAKKNPKVWLKVLRNYINSGIVKEEVYEDNSSFMRLSFYKNLIGV